MFKSYMEFILKNVENSNITKDIIYINQKMLYRLNNKKHKYDFIGGVEKIDKNSELPHRTEL